MIKLQNSRDDPFANAIGQRPASAKTVFFAVVVLLLVVVGVILLLRLTLFDRLNGSHTPVGKSKHTESVQSVAFSADGKRIVSGGGDRTVIVWEADNGEQVFALPPVSFLVKSVAFLRDDKRILAAGGRHDSQAGRWWGVFTIFDAHTGKVAVTIDEQPEIRCAVASPDGKDFATGHADGTIVVRDADTGGRKREIKTDQENWVDSLAYSPDGKRLASASSDGTVKVFDAASGEQISVLMGHKGHVHCVAFSSDGKHIASAGRDKAVIVWDAEASKSIHTLEGHKGYIHGLAFSPDSKRLASGSRLDNAPNRASAPGEIKVWDIEGGKEVMAVTGHKGDILVVAYSSDNKRFVTSGGGKGPQRRLLGSLIPWPEITMWDAKSGAEVFSIGGP